MACDNTDAHRDARLEYLRVYLESADRDGNPIVIPFGRCHNICINYACLAYTTIASDPTDSEPRKRLFGTPPVRQISNFC